MVETEIWPNLFEWVHQQGARLLIVNGRLSAKTMRLRRNLLFRRTLTRVTHIGVRSQLDFERFSAFGVPDTNMIITGNVKYDYQPKTLEAGPLVDWLSAPEPLVIFASISTDEVPLLAPAARTLLAEHPNCRLLWAPRHLRDLETHMAVLNTMAGGLSLPTETGTPPPPGARYLR